MTPKELYDLLSNFQPEVETFQESQLPLFTFIIMIICMEISKYTILIRHQKGLFVYNSLNNCLIQTDEDLFAALENLKDKSFDPIELTDDVEITSKLRKALFLIDNKGDDLLLYQSVIWNRRRTPDVYNITIAPTMDCNFHCYYCFETPTKGLISNETIRRISKYISETKDASVVNLTWFGGEPLLAKKQIIQLSKLIKLPKETHLGVTIITNGYFLDEEFIKILSALYVENIQITLDGLWDDYNKVKSMREDKHCFNKILKNIDVFAKYHKDISLHIRVNMDKTNMHKFHEISTFFKERYPYNSNIFVYAAFLKNINNTTAKNKLCYYCDIEDQVDFSLSIFEKTLDKKYLYPQNGFYECAIRNHNSWAFGPDGSVYKCWENIGNTDNKIGFIDENGKIQISDEAKLIRYCFGADPLYDNDCKDCFYLPICHGKCPNQRILNELHLAKKQPCMKDTKCIDRYLESLISRL